MNPLTIVQKIIAGALTAALAASLIWGALGHMGKRHYEKLWTNEKASHKSDNDRWTAAQALANAQATSAKLAREAHDEQIRKEAESAYSAQLADARARLADYVRLHSAPRANQGSAGAGNLPLAGQAASEPDGPLADPLIPVPLSDLNSCAEVWVRLKNARDWALKLEEK